MSFAVNPTASCASFGAGVLSREVLSLVPTFAGSSCPPPPDCALSSLSESLSAALPSLEPLVTSSLALAVLPAPQAKPIEAINEEKEEKKKKKE
ncbi:uncharacterized protein LTR77_006643 [Saxophila tyrrhenica]|uniref:Secreted protein n=1 Tax=Saxophila tyrrhenica TaxID=1690608 RepID=A0AAV9P8U3_9PEZI|nr:hypothetical protein LTR77_006643 [Saxophila tyrrhenica]